MRVGQSAINSEQCPDYCSDPYWSSLPCDAMQAWPMPSCGVHLSVCHIHVFCQNKLTYFQKFFTIGLPHHSSFCIPNVMAIFQQGPP